MTARQHAGRSLVPLLLLLFLAPGCILVRTTEHSIRLNKDGSGEARLRLVDLRSDGATDSAVVRDYGVLMGSLEKDGYKDFEQDGRKVSDAQFFLHGDTLGVEIRYAFKSLTAVEGLRVKPDELFMTVADTREVVRTNGRLSTADNKMQKISWPRNATRLSYVIREKQLPPTTSLAPLYRKFGR